MQKITCPTCQHLMVVDDQPFDRVATCPRCNCDVEVPANVALPVTKKPSEQDKYPKKKTLAVEYLASPFPQWIIALGWLFLIAGTLGAIGWLLVGDYIQALAGAIMAITCPFYFHLASFLRRLDRAAHKILND